MCVYVIFNTSAGCAYVSRLLESFRAFRPCLSACVCACVSVLVHTCDSDSIPIYPTTTKTRSSRTSVPLGINHFAHQDSSRFFLSVLVLFFFPACHSSLTLDPLRTVGRPRSVLHALDTGDIGNCQDRRCRLGFFVLFLVCSPHLSRLALFRVV